MAGPLTIGPDAHLAPGDNTSGTFNGVGTFSVGGDLTLGTNSVLDIDITSGGQDLLVVGGTVSLGSKLTLNLADEYTPDASCPPATITSSRRPTSSASLRERSW